MINARAGDRLDNSVGARSNVDQRGGTAPVLVARVGEKDLGHVSLAGEEPVDRPRLRIALTAAAERKDVGRVEERREPMGVARRLREAVVEAAAAGARRVHEEAVEDRE